MSDLLPSDVCHALLGTSNDAPADGNTPTEESSSSVPTPTKVGSPAPQAKAVAPLPSLNPRDVLVALEAISIDDVDRALIRKQGRSSNLTAGRSFSGYVASVGSEVTDIEAGNVVFGLTEPGKKSCDLPGFITSDRMYLAKAPSDGYLKIAALSALAGPGMIAEEILAQFGMPLSHGARVLILNATNGVGLFTLQAFARLKEQFDLRIVAHAPSDASNGAVSLCNANGADEVVVGGASWAMTSILRDNNFNLVIDPCFSRGSGVAEAARRVLSPGGTFVSYDPFNKAASSYFGLKSLKRTLLRSSDRKHIRCGTVGSFGSINPVNAHLTLESISQALLDGAISPRIDEELSLANASQAFDAGEGSTVVIRLTD